MFGTSIDAIVLLVIIGVVASILSFLVGRKNALMAAEKRHMDHMLDAYIKSQALLLEHEKNARKAQEAGASGSSTLSDIMSDETYRIIYGHDRTHS